MGEPAGDGNRWRSRPVLAGVVGVAVFALPVVCSIATAALLGYLWGPTGAVGATVSRWAAILAASTFVFVGCERLARRAIPLSVLLKMGMVFPGRAPKRFLVARRSWTTRDLSRRIDQARDQGIVDEPTVAAEQIVAFVGSVSGRTTVAYRDTTVGGLGTRYTYEVEAVAGSSSATSGPASTTTPTLCL